MSRSQAFPPVRERRRGSGRGCSRTSSLYCWRLASVIMWRVCEQEKEERVQSWGMGSAKVIWLPPRNAGRRLGNGARRGTCYPYARAPWHFLDSCVYSYIRSYGCVIPWILYVLSLVKQYTIHETRNQAKLQLPKTESRALVNYY